MPVLRVQPTYVPPRISSQQVQACFTISPRILQSLGESKIKKLYLPPRRGIKTEIIGFDITIHNLLRMQVLNSSSNVQSRPHPLFPKRMQCRGLGTAVPTEREPVSRVVPHKFSPKVELAIQRHGQSIQNDKVPVFVRVRIGDGTHADNVGVHQDPQKISFNGQIDHALDVLVDGQVGPQCFQNELVLTGVVDAPGKIFAHLGVLCAGVVNVVHVNG